jgi:hypothetical protein
MRHDLRQKKQKLIAENLPMTESEAVKFWAVYQKYSAELKDINDEKFDMIHSYAQNWRTMSNDPIVKKTESGLGREVSWLRTNGNKDVEGLNLKGEFRPAPNAVIIQVRTKTNHKRPNDQPQASSR